MQMAVFNSYCPFEIGDLVKYKDIFKPVDDRLYRVADILAIHSVKLGTVSFKVIAVAGDGTTVTAFANNFRFIKEGATT